MRRTRSLPWHSTGIKQKGCLKYGHRKEFIAISNFMDIIYNSQTTSKSRAQQVRSTMKVGKFEVIMTTPPNQIRFYADAWNINNFRHYETVSLLVPRWSRILPGLGVDLRLKIIFLHFLLRALTHTTAIASFSWLETFPASHGPMAQFELQPLSHYHQMSSFWESMFNTNLILGRLKPPNHTRIPDRDGFQDFFLIGQYDHRPPSI